MAFNYSPKPVIDSSLVLYLDAANPRSYVSGSTAWTDISRGGNTGALTNGPTYNVANGGNLVFDGTDDYIKVNARTNINNLSTLTINIFAKINVLPSVNGRLLDKASTGGTNGWVTRLMNNGRLAAYHADGVGDINYTETTNTITSGIIYNFCYTFDGTRWKIYTNGVENSYASQTATPGSLPNDSSYNLGIAGIDGTNIRNLNCNIYLCSLHNRVFSITEIRQNYNALKGRFGLR